MKGASHIAPFGLRMPEELKDKISESAKKNGRSMNSEIVQILEDAMQSSAQHSPDRMVSFVDSKGEENRLPIETVQEVLLYAAKILRKHDEEKDFNTDK